MSVVSQAPPAPAKQPTVKKSDVVLLAQLGVIVVLIAAITVLGALHVLSTVALVGLLGVIVGHQGGIAVGSAIRGGGNG